jgi:NhaA family Na+:H+ antiporter
VDPDRKLDTAHSWINDALMAVFFFVVGLEVKREMISGNLADARCARLPVLAAAAGWRLPALVYLRRRWRAHAGPRLGDPGRDRHRLRDRRDRASRQARAAGLAAVPADRGDRRRHRRGARHRAVLHRRDRSGLDAGRDAGDGGTDRAQPVGVGNALPYVLLSLALWFCVLNSGIHATVAGVVAALTIPTRSRDGGEPLERFEHALTGWNLYLIVPLFGFANAGVTLGDLPAGSLSGRSRWRSPPGS